MIPLGGLPEDYFMRSEQLPTRLFIRTGDVDGKPAAGGMLLQVMPAQNAQQDDFDHRATLTETIKTEELLTLPANEVLWRLYHEEEVTVYDPQDVEFKCTCSRERCADALKTLPDEEVDSIPAEDGEIDMHCDYCGKLSVQCDGYCRDPQQRVSGRSASSLSSMSGREDSAGFYD